jgi:hypothetical protein
LQSTFFALDRFCLTTGCLGRAQLPFQPNISVEDELAAEIKFAADDDVFDEYMEETGMDGVYERWV